MSKKPSDTKITKASNPKTIAAGETVRVDDVFMRAGAKKVANQQLLISSLRPAVTMTDLVNAQAKTLNVHSDVFKRLPTIPKIPGTKEFARIARTVENATRDVDLVRFGRVLPPSARVKILQREPQVAAVIPISSVTDVGRLVRAQRKKQKLSQQAFADVAGVGRRFISELENGKRTLEFDKVLKVMTAAGIDMSARER